MGYLKFIFFATIFMLISGLADATDWWPMFRHDSNHTGYSTGQINAQGLALLWDYPFGSILTSNPTIVNDVVFMGSWDNKVYALNASTGEHIWNYTTGDIVLSSPAISAGVVFVGSFDDKVYALNASTGEHIWNYTTGDDVNSSVVVSDDVVFIGSDDNKVYALNATTGGHIWNYTTGDNVESSPAVANGLLYIGSWDRKTYALNATTGGHIWNYTTGSYIYASPAVANGIVLIGSAANVHALNATTGGHIWDYGLGGYIYSSPTVANGMVFIGTSDNKLYAFGPDISAPSVTLNSPADSGKLETSNVTFNYTPSDQSVIANCALYGNFSGAWALNQTNTTITKDAQNIFVIQNLPDSKYVWNVKCTDSSDNSAFASSNYTFRLDTSGYVRVCASDCDSTTIQGGIDLASNGDTVFIHNGTYYERPNISKPINLLGENQDGVIIHGSDANATAIGISVYNVNISNLSIQHIYYGLTPAQVSARSWVSKVTFSNVSRPIWTSQDANCTFQNITFIGGNSEIKGSGYVIRYNTFVSSNLTTSTDADKLQILNNNFSNSILNLNGINNSVVSNNVITGGSYGIQFGSGYLSSSTNISYNNISGTTYGIYFNRIGSGVRVFDNDIFSNTYGVYFDAENVVFHDNNVSNNANYGVYLPGGNDYNQIYNNQITSNGQYGVILKSNSNYNTLTNNTILYHTVYDINNTASYFNNISGNTACLVYNDSILNNIHDNVCPDIIAPNITLNLPSNGSMSFTGNLNFAYTPTDDSSITNCSLYTNLTGSWAVNQTSTSVTSGSQNTFSVTNVPDGVYLWNVECGDSEGYSGFALSNYTIWVHSSLTITVCALGCDYTNIQAAVDAASAGNIIYVQSGTYDSTGSSDPANRAVTVSTNNITLQGENKNTTIIDCEESTSHGILIYASYVTLSDLTIKNCTSNGIGGSAANTTISNMIFSDIDSNCVGFGSGANYTLENSIFTNCGNYGIYHNCGVSDGLIKNNTFYSNSYDIFLRYSDCGVQELTVNNTVIDNTVCTITYDSSTNAVENNTCPTNPPSVSLTSPSNNSNDIDGSVTFSYTPSDETPYNLVTITNCSLYTNATGNWTINQTDASINNNISNTFSLPLNEGTYQWNVNCTDRDGNSAFASSNYTFKVMAVAINEFLPNPSGSGDEWIEIFNNRDTELNLSGWQLDDGTGGSDPYIIPLGTTIAAKRFVLFYAATTNLTLGDISDEVRLFDADGYLIDNYPWSITVDGVSFGRETDGGSEWSTFSTPTPGDSNIGELHSNIANIFINEFLPNPGRLGMEWIELYNNGSESQNLSGWQLDDARNSGSDPYTIPNGTSISEGDFLAFYKNDTNITLGDLGDTIRIRDSNGELVEEYTYSYSQHGVSIGRSTDGGSEWTTFEAPTPGATNSGVNDSTPPIISLVHPLDGYVDRDGYVFVTYQPVDQSRLSYCMLYIVNTSGTWTFEQLDTSVFVNTQNGFLLTGLSNGTYVWNVKCQDVNGYYAFSTSNRTFSVQLFSNRITYSTEIDVILNEMNSVNSSDGNVTLEMMVSENVSGASITISTFTNSTRNATLAVPSLSKYMSIDVSPDLLEGLIYALIKVYYTDAELTAANLTENNISMYWYNESLNVWQQLNDTTMEWVYGTGIDTTNDYLWANVTHFSDYTVAQTGAQSTESIALTMGWNLISFPLVI